jgi:hypothetical protein
MSENPIKSWSGLLPPVMSSAVLALIAVDDLFALNPLPIHDEGAIDHLGMLLMAGQIPVILYFAFSGRKHLARIIPALALQCVLWGGVLGLVYSQEQSAKDFVNRRRQENAPLPGSQAALRRYLQQADATEASILPTRNMGALQSLTFRGVDRLGWDIYQAGYAAGDLEWRLFVTSNGRIRGLTLVEGGSGCRSTEPYECRSQP